MSKKNKRRRQNNPVVRVPSIGIPGGVEVPAVVSHQLTTQFSYSGPLPPPGILQQFNEVVPGMAERILVMAETQANHRIALEKKVINSDIIKSYLGLGAAFIIALTGIGVGGWLINTGHDTAGAAFVGTFLTGLVGTFITGAVIRRRERTEKSKIMTGAT